MYVGGGIVCGTNEEVVELLLIFLSVACCEMFCIVDYVFMLIHGLHEHFFRVVSWCGKS